MSGKNKIFEIPDDEIDLKAIRSSGPGGQHANKVATAVQLKFDIKESSLPEHIKEKLLAVRDNRISEDGVLTIKVQKFRSQFRNREEALKKLNALIAQVSRPVKQRIKTTPTKASQQERLVKKKRRSEIKSKRKKIDLDKSDLKC